MSNDESIYTGLTLDDVRKLYPIRRKSPENSGAHIRSQFFIIGETLERTACTAAVGMEPSEFLEQRVQGQLMPSGRPNVLSPAWSLQVVREPSLDVDGCLGELLAMLWPKRKEIKAFLEASRYQAGFDTYVIVFEDTPVCELTPVTLERLAEFGLNWGFGWHDVTPSGEPDGAAKA